MLLLFVVLWVSLAASQCGGAPSKFPYFGSESSIERIAGQIIAGEKFKLEMLSRERPIIVSFLNAPNCRPEALHSAAVVQVRVHEIAASVNDIERTAESRKSLSRIIDSSLSCAPADPFLWLALGWVEESENGSKPDYLDYLRMSYRLGANEGWIALNRNRVAFAKFRELPPDLAESTIAEFIALVRNGFYRQSVDILTSSAWPQRDLILLRLKGVNDQTRQNFADELKRRGYELSVPGITSSSPHHWH